MSVKLPPLANIEYCVTHINPTLELPDISNTEPYHVVTSSLVRDMEKGFSVFQSEIEAEIALCPSDTALIVLPEYCWRDTPPVEVFKYIDELKEKLSPHLTMVLGTLEFKLNGKYTNNAIIISDKRTWFVPKTKVLDGEIHQNMVPGENPGVIRLPLFTLAVVVCADLWEASLIHKLVIQENADILVAPSWTATRKGNRQWAKLDFITLAKSRSLEFSIPVVVSDHYHNRPTTDVANALIIADPSNRQIPLPLEEYIDRIVHKIYPVKVVHARQRWANKGLAPHSK